MKSVLALTIVSLLLVHLSDASCSPSHIGDCDDAFPPRHPPMAGAGDILPCAMLILFSIIFLLFPTFSLN
ncbi:hypothetical protein O3M35_006905 [Rhynocoris fuscipes]|uniref:Uncharacterized protein n=1 Tax=Rhynocoris fuscipes TaxID=488301 RepID=A0AAW1DHL7_9HEMI